MSSITKVRIRNFRSHKDSEYIFLDNVNIISGKNGAGKTTILEAIHYSFRGVSFKATDKDILKHNQPWWSIEAILTNNKIRKISYNSQVLQKRKKFIIDDNIFYRMPTKNKLPVVLFEPDHLRLLNGSPQRRRQFIDNFICQIDPGYQNTLNKYERALKQRNTILKNLNNKKDDLFVWDMALCEYGSEIINQRILFIERINKQISDIYKNISGTKDIITVHYSNTLIDNIKDRLFKDLDSNYNKDKILGFTTTGPHRHDVFFYINDSPALSVASRGEIRTILLSLKYLEVVLIEEISKQSPIILLDDVYSELDDDRQKGISQLTSKNQVIITTTNNIKINKLNNYIII